MKKLSDLKIPFSFEKRRPIIIEKLLIIPAHYDAHDKWGEKKFLTEKIFKNNKKIFIEYCSGNGEWIVKKASKNKNINWIAVEIRLDRARRIWKKMHNQNLENLFVVLGDGYTFTKFYVREKSISSVYINFPDPWPKRRHEKHRLITKNFIKELEKILKRGGEIFFVTDDEDFSKRALNYFLDNKSFESAFKKPYFVEEVLGYGDSYFKTLWKGKGKKIRYFQFLKKNNRGRGIRTPDLLVPNQSR